MAKKNPDKTYLRVADELWTMVTSNKFTDALPPTNDLARMFGVSRSTTRRALDVLRDEGILEVTQGIGWYVEGTRDSRTPTDRLTELVHSSKPGDTLPSETELAEQLSMSRTALRPAIAVLLTEGVLIRGRRRRLIIAHRVEGL